MGYTLGKRSTQRLSGVHPDLVAVIEKAIQITGQDFSVIEGLRSETRQKHLVAKGKSTTMNSRHLTGHAVDLAPYPFHGDMDEDGIPNIEDWDQYYLIADAILAASKELRIPIRWGGNWRVPDITKWDGTGKELAKAYPGDFPDGPHFELSRAVYP